MYNPATGYDDPNYDPNNDPNGYTTQPDPNTGQPPPAQNPGPQGVGSPGNDANQIQGWASEYLGRNFTDADIAGLAGQPLGLVQNNIANSPEAQAYARRNATSGAQPVAPSPGLPTSGGGRSPWDGFFPGTTISQDPRFGDLVTTLLGRAGKSLDIDPSTDSVIRPQVDNYAAQQERARRNYLNEKAESSSPYATGSMENARTQTAEQAGINTSNLQSSLMTNELSARRNEIQQALSEAGALLTGNQQMSLQQELGLLDAQLKKQGITNQNDQFFADLGLRTGDRANYWDALNSGKLG